MRSSILLLVSVLFCGGVFAQDYSVRVLIDGEIPTSNTLNTCQGITYSFSAEVDYGTSGADPDQTQIMMSYDGEDLIGSSTARTFIVPSTHRIQVQAINEDLGLSANDEIQIHVSGEPDFDQVIADNIGSMLLGEQEVLFSSVEPGNPGNVLPVDLVVFSEMENGFTTFLPDGTGDSYESSISVSSAPSESVVGSEFDIPQIRASLEHSYLGDLKIDLECPNGNSVTLQNQGGGSCNLGFPWATSPVDGESNNLSLGQGLIYSWDVDGESWLDSGCIDGIEFISGDGPGTYTDSQVASGNYASEEPLANLLGCPINGDWKLIITDYLGADNGYVIAWGMTFPEGVTNPEISDDGPELLSLEWLDSEGVIANNGNEITISPTEAVPTSFTLRATDSYGCSYERNVPIDVWDPNSVEELNELGMAILVEENQLTINATTPTSGFYHAELLDLSGRLISQIDFNQSAIIRTNAKATMLLRVYNSEGQQFIRKVQVY